VRVSNDKLTITGKSIAPDDSVWMEGKSEATRCKKEIFNQGESK